MKSRVLSVCGKALLDSGFFRLDYSTGECIDIVSNEKGRTFVSHVVKGRKI